MASSSIQESAFRVLPLRAKPAEVAASMADQPGFVFLDSSMAGPGAVSILGWAPEKAISGSVRDWPVLERALDQHARRSGHTAFPDGAAIGWVGFDGGFQFGLYPELLVYPHDSGRWMWNGDDEPEIGFSKVGSADVPATGVLEFQPELDRGRFLEMVRRALEYIAAGDIYQVCLSHRFRAAASPAQAWPYYRELRRVSPAPFAAYMNMGGVRVASSSMELFLDLNGRHVRTRPIKGTRPRHQNPERDAASARELLESAKERAELLMITDLERNDLGRVCEFGSVRVADLLALERYEQVYHLVSTVEGTLRADVSHASALRACFPGGSISGAPKIRALEIIAELEPVPRGIYTGAIGFFGFNGVSRFNIAIRTAVFQQGMASFHSGAGIVADSVPEREWLETLDKAAGLLTAAGRLGG